MNLGWWRALAWLLAYVALALLPMAIALGGDRPAPRAFLVEAGAMLGLLGLGVLSAQAVVSGRQRWFARGLGQDDLLQFHRQTGLLGLGLVLAHPATLILADPRFIAFLDPRDQLLRAVSLSFVLVACVLLVATSLWRLRFGLRYEHWRALHGVLALAVVGLGLGHALMVGHHTGTFWKQLLLAAAVGGAIVLMLETRLRRPWRARPWRLTQVRCEHDDSTTLRLVPDGHPGLRFSAGQFVWLTLGPSPWRLQQHPFSLAGSQYDADGAVEVTIKALGDFTRTVANLAPGTRAWLEGPYGVFTYTPGQSPAGAVFVAGGVGITPIMGILRSARDRGARERFWLIHASQALDAIIFDQELQALSRTLDLTVVPVLETPPDGWTGESGRINADVIARHLPRDLRQIPCYVCGPAAMADVVEPALLARGAKARNLYCERFDMV